jgi:hypothetical protein
MVSIPHVSGFDMSHGAAPPDPPDPPDVLLLELDAPPAPPAPELSGSLYAKS